MVVARSRRARSNGDHRTGKLALDSPDRDRRLIAAEENPPMGNLLSAELERRLLSAADPTTAATIAHSANNICTSQNKRYAYKAAKSASMPLRLSCVLWRQLPTHFLEYLANLLKQRGGSRAIHANGQGRGPSAPSGAGRFR